MDSGRNDGAHVEAYPVGPGGAPEGYVAAAPGGYYANDWGPTHPTTMPGPVRAAQIISWVFGGVGLVLSVVAGVIGNIELVGALLAGFLPAFFLALFAFGFTVNGNGLRIASIVFASFGILWGLSGTVQGLPPGLLGFGASLAIVILLSQRRAGEWFKRPH
ncbi:hypothetical protein [Nocardia shimofusensis]|uniref:hypothetical protein n=1 Tax=Nocardia shimofusensis TaxID=228596 RepID=UPI000AED8735|nr:hypothetical protein [Nocardia shimofusensis]